VSLGVFRRANLRDRKNFALAIFQPIFDSIQSVF